MNIPSRKLGLLCAFGLCLTAGCENVYNNDHSVHTQPPGKVTLTLEPTNSTSKIKVPVEVQVEAKSTNEVRLPVNVKVEPASNAPLKVAVAVTNDAASPLIVPVTLRADTNGIPITCTSPGKGCKEKWGDMLLDLLKVVLGIFIGGFITFGFWRRQKQIEFTVGFSEKYNSSEMTAARARAWKFLSNYFVTDKQTRAVTKNSKNTNKPLKMSNIEGEYVYFAGCITCKKEEQSDLTLGDVLIILHYFERIAVMGRKQLKFWSWKSWWYDSSHRMVNRPMISEHLGYEFLFWYQYIKHLRDDELGATKNGWQNATEEEWKKSQSTWKQLFKNIEEARPWLIPTDEKENEEGIAGSPLR